MCIKLYIYIYIIKALAQYEYVGKGSVFMKVTARCALQGDSGRMS